MSIAGNPNDKPRWDGAIHRKNVLQASQDKRDQCYMDFLQKVHVTDFGHWSDLIPNLKGLWTIRDDRSGRLLLAQWTAGVGLQKVMCPSPRPGALALEIDEKRGVED